MGVYASSRLLYGQQGLKQRISGSDYYALLVEHSIKNHWRLFFFGDCDNIYEGLKTKNPQLTIVGFQNGYDYDSKTLISSINGSRANILIVGLGQPKQEKWIVENRDKLEVNVIIAVGDGIKVFAGTKKRGYKIIQLLGFEWLVRLVNNPKLYWKRYILGIPLFIFRIIIFKFKLLFD